MKEAKITEIQINEARENYRPAAERASLLYFILNDLNKINPIYQFSLKVTNSRTCCLDSDWFYFCRKIAPSALMESKILSDFFAETL